MGKSTKALAIWLEDKDNFSPMPWSLDAITGLINVVALLPLVLVLMAFYWISFRRRLALIVSGTGGVLYALAVMTGYGFVWLSLALLYHLALGLLVFLLIGMIADGLWAFFRKQRIRVARNNLLTFSGAFVLLVVYISFNNHLVYLIARASQEATPKAEIASIAQSRLVWASPALFEALVNNPEVPESTIVSLYQRAETPLQRYQLLRHDNMPCALVKEFMETYGKSEQHAWMVAMAQRNHYMRCHVPEIYTLTEDEIMERTPLWVLETMSSEMYGSENTPPFLQEWIEKKRELKRRGKPDHTGTLPGIK